MKKYFSRIVIFIVGLLMGGIISSIVFTQFLYIEYFKDRLQLGIIANKVYRTGEINASIVVLDNLANTLESYQKLIKTKKSKRAIEDRDEIRQDLGLIYGRLFILYEKAGKQDLADHYYSKAKELFNSRCPDKKKIFSPSELKEFIEKVDSKQDKIINK